MKALLLKEKNEASHKIGLTKLLSGMVVAPTWDEFEKLVSIERRRSDFKIIQEGLIENKLIHLEKEVLPYDHTRVQLSHNTKFGGYINASWVSLPEDKKDYDAIINLPYLPFSQMGIIASNVPT